ncbi:MAG: NUDIX hydrolase [Thiotrichales bacterium]|nr:NUDIX hydrolase [Thiotrichales bacterium]
MTQKTPPQDNRPRYVCDNCEVIHYQNPKIVTGCLPVWDDQVLLCKRSIEPRCGYWTLPAGFMEMDETSIEGAIRETWEEATARVEVQGLYSVFNLPHVNQVYMMFRSRLIDLEFSPGLESQDVQLFREEEIPWDKLAFTTVRQTLKFYFEDRPADLFPLRTGNIIKLSGDYRFEPGPEEQT